MSLLQTQDDRFLPFAVQTCILISDTIVLSWKVHVGVHFPLQFHTLCLFIRFGHKPRIYSVFSFQKLLPSLSFFKSSLSFLYSIIPDTSFHGKLHVRQATNKDRFSASEISRSPLSSFPAKLNKTADTIYCRLSVAHARNWQLRESLRDLCLLARAGLVYNICNYSSLTLLSESKFIFNKH